MGGIAAAGRSASNPRRGAPFQTATVQSRVPARAFNEGAPDEHLRFDKRWETRVETRLCPRSLTH
jgi:hypothetical protein